MEDLTGKQLGQYQIIAPLGEGGMAAVYKAYQLGKMNRDVALKILPQQLAKQPEFIKRFDREANVLAKLQHPRILPVFDFGESDGYTYLAMPFIESGTLADLLHGKPLPLPQIRSLVVQVAEALDYAHSHRLVHRDVKPSNVLVDERGNCLLSDFGIAKILEGTEKFTSTGGVIGTPAYMSPEQGRGETLDQRSDIYSLGVMLYEMATGRVPFQAETPLALIIKHMQDPLPPPRSINPALPEAIEQVIFNALAKRREDRYQTAGEIARAIQAAIPESTVPLDQTQAAASPVEGWTETIRRKKVKPEARLPKWIWVVGGMLLIVLSVPAAVINASSIIGAIIRPTETLVPATAMLSLTEESTIQPTARLSRPSPMILTATYTPQSTAEPTSGVVSDALVTFEDTFGNSSLAGWYAKDDVVVDDGVVHINGNSRWPNLIGRRQLHEGEASLVSFKYSEETENFFITLESGEWNDSNHRQWGFYLDPNNRFSTSLMTGQYQYGGDSLRGNLDPSPNRWYFALLRIEGPTEFSLRVWEKDNPDKYREFYYQMDNNWKDKTWHAVMGADSGILQLDSYQELKYTP
jgi:serine/threonine protein kinase